MSPFYTQQKGLRCKIAPKAKNSSLQYVVYETIMAIHLRNNHGYTLMKQPILFVSELLAELLLQGDVIKIVDTHGVAHLTHGLSCHLTGLF